jgi:hypothetical protein
MNSNFFDILVVDYIPLLGRQSIGRLDRDKEKRKRKRSISIKKNSIKNKWMT